jgi:prepilin-type N-terminal cleavage/methylation domain-containing protein/prepilin-type processing-associated H-X9-DG protein
MKPPAINRFRCFLEQCPGSGFTFVELLVVIAIVSVLAALLLPALGKAMTDARKINCINDKKQWALAFYMYVDENEGLIPREGYEPTGTVIWNNWAQVKEAKDVWYNSLPPYLSRHPASDYSNPSQHAAFYAKSSFFQCPSAKIPSDVTGAACHIAIFSRSMNSYLIEPWSMDRRTCTVNFNRIAAKDPSKVVLFLDNRLDGEKKVVPGQDDQWLGQPSSHASRFPGFRHGLGGNLAFADGHAVWFKWQAVVSTNGWQIEPPQQIIWDPSADY